MRSFKLHNTLTLSDIPSVTDAYNESSIDIQYDGGDSETVTGINFAGNGVSVDNSIADYYKESKYI